MADAIQKLKDSMNRGITTISVKTSSSLEKSKINMHIDSLEKEIQGLFHSVGTGAYGLWESGALNFQPLEETLSSIKQKKAEIAQLAAERDSIDQRDSQILGMTAQNSAPQPSPASVGIICLQCGAAYDTPVKFCRKCGCNLQNQYQ